MISTVEKTTEDGHKWTHNKCDECGADSCGDGAVIRHSKRCTSKCQPAIVSAAPLAPVVKTGDLPATDRQIAYLRDLVARDHYARISYGDDFVGLTRAQASTLIDGIKAEIF